MGDKPKKPSTYSMLKSLDNDVQSSKPKKESSSRSSYDSRKRRSSVSPIRDSYDSKSSSSRKSFGESVKKPKVTEIILDDDDDDDNIDYDIPDRSHGDLYCKACDSHMNSEPMWESHIQGKRHQKHIKKIEAPDLKYDFSKEDAIFQAEAAKSKELLIGLQHCCEIQRVDAKPMYQCFLCSNSLPNSNQLIEHVVGIKHRMSYLKEHDPVKFDLISKADLKKGMIEPVVEECIQMHFEKYGRGRMQVKIEKPKPKTKPPPKKPAPNRFPERDIPGRDIPGKHFSNFNEKYDEMYGPVRSRNDRMNSFSDDDKMDPKFDDKLYGQLSPKRPFPDQNEWGYTDNRLRRDYGDDLYPDLPYERSRYKEDLYPRYDRDNQPPRERDNQPPRERDNQFPRERDNQLPRERTAFSPPPYNQPAYSSSSINAKQEKQSSSRFAVDKSATPHAADLRDVRDQRKVHDTRNQDVSRAQPESFDSKPTPSNTGNFTQATNISNMLQNLVQFVDALPMPAFLQIVLNKMEQLKSNNPTDEELSMVEKIGNLMISFVLDKKVEKLSPDLLTKYQQMVKPSAASAPPPPPPRVEPMPIPKENKSSNLSGLMDLISYFKTPKPADATAPSTLTRQIQYQSNTNNSSSGSEPAFMTQSSSTFFGSPEKVSIPGLTLSENNSHQSYEQVSSYQNKAELNAAINQWNNPYNRYKM